MTLSRESDAFCLHAMVCETVANENCVQTSLDECNAEAGPQCEGTARVPHIPRILQNDQSFESDKVVGLFSTGCAAVYRPAQLNDNKAVYL